MNQDLQPRRLPHLTTLPSHTAKDPLQEAPDTAPPTQMPRRALPVGAGWFLFLLGGPGTLSGVWMLLAMQGLPLGVPVPPSTHGMAQAVAFMVLIGGFLTHAWPGMVGAHEPWMQRVRLPLHGVGTTTLATMAADAAALEPAWRGLFRGLLCAAACALVGVVLHATFTAARPWFRAPFVTVLVGLCCLPAATALWWAQVPGMWGGVSAPGVCMVGVVLVILGMGYQMFGPMLALQPPHAGLFTAGSLGWACAALTTQGLPGARWPWWGMVALSGVVGLSLRAHRPRRGVMKHVPRDAGQRLLRAHILLGLACFLCAPWVGALAPEPYAADVARHLLGLGFCGAVTLGIGSRVLPRMLGHGRGVPLGAASTNLVLLALGLVLRLVRLNPSASSGWVMASAALSGAALTMGCAWIAWALQRPRAQTSWF